MNTQLVAEKLWRISLIQPDLLNVYLAEDVLIDSGSRFSVRTLLRFLESRPPSAHALTHAHPDHQGASHGICERFDIPLYCGEGDREAQESGRLEELMPGAGFLVTRLTRLLSGPPHPVARSLRQGDEVGGMEVIATPGHTLGHVSFWRERDRVLILGDVLFHRHPVTLRKGLSEPLGFATMDRALNLASARKVAALNPAVVCFGHGAPLMDGDRFHRFVESLHGA